MIWSSAPILQSVLSVSGPLGPLGPLGRNFGIIGKNWWQASFWNDAVFDQVAWKNQFLVNLYAPYGPLSERGPLGPNGPIGNWQEGPYNILGTGGTLGPIGPLGPLGPIGAPQWKGLLGPDKNGEYRDRISGKIVDRVEIDTREGKKRFPIFEYYAEDYALKLSQEKQLDASFLVDGKLKANQTTVEYLIEPEFDSIVTAHLIPDPMWTFSKIGLPVVHNLTLKIFDSNGKPLLISDEANFINVGQIFVKANHTIKVVIERQNLLPITQDYRLIIAGDEHPERILGDGNGQFPLQK